MTVGSKRFLLGCVAGCGLGVGLNLLPLLRSRWSDVADDYELIGFPLIFRRAGGFAYTEQFLPGALLVDVAFCVLLSIFAGWIGMKFPRARGSGFPVLDSHT